MKKRKKTWSLNSKKCSRARDLSWVIPGLLACLLPSLPCSAAPIVETIEKEIQNQGTTSFDHLIQTWEDSYGTNAVAPLLSIAKNQKKDETKRYIALMGAAKLGGKGILSEVQKFLKDSSWMLRSGSLRLLALLGTSETGQAIYPLLKDPALVVRTEAVETIRVLKPPGAAHALLNTLQDPANYHRGKALWVPQRVLYAFVDLRAAEMASKISLFIHSPQRPKDPQFIRLMEKTVETLNRQSSTETTSSSH